MAWLVRLILGALAWRMTRARQTGRPVVDVPKLRRQVDSAREGVSIAGRLLVVVVLASFCAGLLAAGSTALALSPRWLGGVLIGLAALFGAAMVPEIVCIRRVVQRRRRRRRALELGQEVERGAPGGV